MRLKWKKWKKLKGIYLRADTINGVYEIGTSAVYESDEICSPKIFLDSLKDLEDGEILTAYFDYESADIYDEIEKTYGIHR